ncbi:MAG: PDZ domain-containing protein [Phycisphaerae bacterium]|nr:PDZ domain-containing protein [Phycisphaerae bacterium]
MTRRWTAWALVAAVALAGSAWGDTGKLLSDAKDKASALARFYCTMQDELGSRIFEGQAVCITTEPAVFLTLSLDGRLPPDSLTGFVLVPAAAPDKQIKAELLGIDPEMNVGFLRAVDPYTWTAVQFAPKANLAVGQEVASVGLMGRETNYQPYVGIGYLSAILHAPGDQGYVTGGRLTGVGSPVFNADGRAIGLVSPQRFLNYQTVLNGRVTGISLGGQDETAFFMPVDEFAHVLLNIPASPAKVRRLPWIGVLSFSGVAKEVADIMKLDSPGVMIEGVIPEGPAAKAGLADRDVILAVNGEKFPPMAMLDMAAAILQRKIFRMSAGAKVTLSVRRGDETKDYEVTLDNLPQLPYEAKRYLSRTLGFLARERIDLDRYADKSAAAGVPGLLVMGTDGPAGSAGLREGDLITSVNQTPVTTVGGLKETVEGAVAKNEAVVLVVRRGDQTQTVTIPPAAQQAPPPRGQ